MNYSDYDLERLARYLNLQTQQVARMADRGKIPGRRIGGEWRFSSAEIHHWLEERIGVSDDPELALMEQVLEHSRSGNDEDVDVVDLLSPATVRIPLDARTRGSVITAMVNLAAETGWLWDPDKLAEAVRQRESLHPTALDNGVALLHPRRPLSSILGQSFLALGRTPQGIPFGHPRGILTDIFILICALDDRTHLRILARLSRWLNRPEVLAVIRDADDELEFWTRIRQMTAGGLSSE